MWRSLAAATRRCGFCAPRGNNPPGAASKPDVRVEHIFAVAALLWPFALTMGVGLLRWKRFQSKAGFLAFGVLGCFGLQAFLARLARYVFWTYFAPREPHSYSAGLRFVDPVVIIVASALLSVPLLVWLTDLLGASPAPDTRGKGRDA